MIKKLDLIFQSASECKEKTLPCKISKNDVIKIYKPDSGIKDRVLEYRLFTTHPPKLSDCVIVYNNDKIALIEIKCGKVTRSLLNDVIEKLTNTFKILKEKEVSVTKCMLLYKKFDNSKTRQLLTLKKYKVLGNRLIEKKYENTAIAV